MKILSTTEIQTVVSDLKTKRRYKSNRTNLIVFRLATCCGLRASEIADLKLGDVDVTSARPHVLVRNGKGGKRRIVPLNWDGMTLADMTAWVAERQSEGATADSFFVVTSKATRIDRVNLRRRFIRSCKPLNRPVTIHDGRHTFVSQSLAGGRSLPAVRDAAGHSNVSVTNIYLHTVPDDGTVGDLFEA